jgi:hypothetical protein
MFFNFCRALFLLYRLTGFWALAFSKEMGYKKISYFSEKTKTYGQDKKVCFEPVPHNKYLSVFSPK